MVNLIAGKFANVGADLFVSVGSGGDIFWDPGYSGTLELGSSGLVGRPAMMLAHEMFHGYESDQGILDNRLGLNAKLSFEEAGILDDTGNLTANAIKTAEEITPGSKLGNSDVVKALTADGTNISDWGKFTTTSVDVNGNRHQLHFYKHKSVTVNTSIDYKIKEVIQEK